MPAAGKKWRHVIINTRSSWLHGDPRGFRDRDHRTHSSGDYRRPPPRGEHGGLYNHRQRHAGPEVHLPHALRPMIGRAMLAYLAACEHRVLAVAVTKVHAHVLVELPNNILRIRDIVGQA